MNLKESKNKGFSLVELIIVIAIMAVLVGVLAPAYLRYVEKSRKSADVQAIDAVMRAMEMVAIDPSLNVTDGTVIKVQLLNTKKTDATSFWCEKSGDVITELKETLGEYQLKSKDWKKIIIQGTVSSGKVNFVFKEDAPDKKGLKDYAPDMNIIEDDSISFQ